VFVIGPRSISTIGVSASKTFRTSSKYGPTDLTKKGNPLSYRTVISVTAAAILGIACVSTEALAYRGGVRGGGVRVGGVHASGVRVGAYRGGVYHGSAYRGAYVRRGVAVGVGAAAVGAAVAAPRYYNSIACRYYPYPPCY